MIILTKGQAQKLKKYLDWSIEGFKHKADELNPDVYSPELQEAMELQELIKKELNNTPKCDK